MRHRTLRAAIAILCLSSCGSSSSREDTEIDAGINLGDPSSRPPYAANWQRDILSYDLQIDLSTQTGVATIIVAGDPQPGMSLDIGSLTVARVYDSFGDLMQLDLGGELLIGVPTHGVSRTIVIDYSFRAQTNFDGWDDNKTLSFLWPAFCGNLYPCNSDPAEGATFTMSVTGTPDGMAGVAIYPEEIPGDAPSYMPAIAFGDYTELPLGTTTAGTNVSVWYEGGQEEDAIAGTIHLVEVFEFLESTYGAYSFGNKVGTVSVDWGGGDFGGMEHHPYWHISSGSLSDEETNAHEAAHGWFGNGVRIECWEDFVLSEGVVTYMAARALEESGVDLWPTYDCQLSSLCNAGSNTTSLLDTCGDIDLINHPLWSSAPYQKGAQFLREVSELLGVNTVDQALAEFYQANVGQAARMRQLIELLKSKGSSAEIEALALAWLETESCPISVDALCPSLR